MKKLFDMRECSMHCLCGLCSLNTRSFFPISKSAKITSHKNQVFLKKKVTEKFVQKLSTLSQYYTLPFFSQQSDFITIFLYSISFPQYVLVFSLTRAQCLCSQRKTFAKLAAGLSPIIQSDAILNSLPNRGFPRKAFYQQPSHLDHVITPPSCHYSTHSV